MRWSNMKYSLALMTFMVACHVGNAAEKPPTKEKQVEVPTQHAMTIHSLAVVLDVDENSEVIDNTKNAGFPSATVYTVPTIFIVGFNEMFWQADILSQKADIQRAPGNKFRKFTKEETNDNGFHLEFELSSMMDPDKTLYGFHIRSTIDGKEFDCSSNAENIVALSKGIETCRTMRSML